MNNTDRQTRYLARRAAGRRSYFVDLIDVYAEEFVANFGRDVADMRAGLTAIFEQMIDLDQLLVTRKNTTLEKVLSSLAEDLRTTVDEVEK